jgi:hypothetical protein
VAETAQDAARLPQCPVDRRTTRRSRHGAGIALVLQAGAVIPAALITGIRSDLPGQITAQVTENIYDSPTGRILLVPQGTRIIGQYDNSVQFGQRRVLLVWNRLILPNGRSIVLERQPGAIPRAMPAWRMASIIIGGISPRPPASRRCSPVGAELAIERRGPADARHPHGAQDTINDAGQQIVRRQLQRRADADDPAGLPGQVIVTRDLVLEPYRRLTMTKLKLGPLRRRQAGQGHAGTARGTPSRPDRIWRSQKASRSCQTDRADAGKVRLATDRGFATADAKLIYHHHSTRFRRRGAASARAQMRHATGRRSPSMLRLIPGARRPDSTNEARRIPCAQTPRARRGRPRQQSPQDLPDDLYDYATIPCRRHRDAATPPDTFDVEKLPVIDDWPEKVPSPRPRLTFSSAGFGDVLRRAVRPD